MLNRFDWRQPFKGSIAPATLLAMVLSVGLGYFWADKFLWLSPISKHIITAIKLVAMPLLFFAILEGFLKAEFKVSGFLRMLAISGLNGVCAISIGLFISHFFRPGLSMPLELPADHHATFSLCLDCPGGFAETTRQHSLLSGTTLVILLALFAGTLVLLMRRFPSRSGPTVQRLKRFNEFCLSLLFTAIHWIVLFIPIAVFASIIKIMATGQFHLARGLLFYFTACLSGMILQVAIVYQTWIKFIAGRSLKDFWRAASEPALYAFGVNSSLATLPITLKALDRLKVSEGSARLSACIGTNFNNDGILLYEVVAIFFLMQAYGIQLSLGQELLVSAICVIATIGVAGVPEAGIISLTLVLSAVGLPQEILPILLTVDWFIARARSTTNALGDMTVAIALDATESGGPSARRRG